MLAQLPNRIPTNDINYLCNLQLITDMALDRLYKHVEDLIQNNEDVTDSIPCKADILSVRDCRNGGKVRGKDAGLRNIIGFATDILLSYVVDSHSNFL